MLTLEMEKQLMGVSASDIGRGDCGVVCAILVTQFKVICFVSIMLILVTVKRISLNYPKGFKLIWIHILFIWEVGSSVSHSHNPPWS